MGLQTGLTIGLEGDAGRAFGTIGGIAAGGILGGDLAYVTASSPWGWLWGM